jgi:DNA-binding protein H-NS
MSQLILMVLFVAAAAVEATLLIASDSIFGAGRTKALEAEIKRTQDDLKEAAKRLKERQSKLREANDENDKQLAKLEEIEKQASKAPRARPLLVHTAGPPGTGKRFRARVNKTLPMDPEAKQKLIWDHDNYVEVWVGDAESARQIAVRQFTAEAGYTVGDFVFIPPPGDEAAPAGLPEKAA